MRKGLGILTCSSESSRIDCIQRVVLISGIQRQSFKCSEQNCQNPAMGAKHWFSARWACGKQKENQSARLAREAVLWGYWKRIFAATELMGQWLLLGVIFAYPRLFPHDAPRLPDALITDVINNCWDNFACRAFRKPSKTPRKDPVAQPVVWKRKH
jgi:hypothetical protein